MHVMQHSRPRGTQRRMYLPSERQVVNGVGLGEVDGMFNIGKMFTRMFTFTPGSFKMRNIAGAIGSAVTTIGTGGIANVVSEVAGPSGLKLTKGTITGAHSKPMQYVGYGTMAAAAAAGLYFGGSAALTALKTSGTVAAGAGTGLKAVTGAGAFVHPVTGAVATTGGGFLSTVGSALSTVGSGLMTGIKVITAAMPVLGKVMGGGGGGQQQQQGGMTQAEYDAQMREQAAYEAQVRAQQAQMYQPGYASTIQYAGGQYAPEQYIPPVIGEPGTMQTSYGDLRSPYTAISEDGKTLQVDPATGQVIDTGMSTTMMIALGGVALAGLGWYFMSDSKSIN